MPYIEEALNYFIKDPEKDVFSQLVENVREIPYGSIGSRRGEDVFKKMKGTCSGKHNLLKELLEAKGYDVREVMVETYYDGAWLNKLTVSVPEKLKSIVSQLNGIKDYHNFLQVMRDGKWLDVDITWSTKLANLGFKVTGPRQSENKLIIIGKDESSSDAKEKLLSKLSPKARSLRKEFIKELSVWVGQLSK